MALGIAARLLLFLLLPLIYLIINEAGDTRGEKHKASRRHCIDVIVRWDALRLRYLRVAQETSPCRAVEEQAMALDLPLSIPVLKIGVAGGSCEPHASGDYQRG